MFVTLDIDKQGNVVNAEIAQGVGGGLDEEVQRVIREATFIPGLKDGVAVKVSMTVPIQFKLGSGFGLRF